MASAQAAGAGQSYPRPVDFYQSAVRKAVLDSVFSPISLPERHDIRYKPAYGSACWAWLPPHRIYIGTAILDDRRLRENLAEDELGAYVGNHYLHELAHALYTERDMKAVMKMLKADSCPFFLYNLFEDARIEQQYRSKAEFQFQWLKYECVKNADGPADLFFGLIQAEGDPQPVRTSLVNDAEILKRFERVHYYYECAIRCENTQALFPLLRQWLKEFPETAQQQGQSQGQGQPADLEISAELMTDPHALSEFEADLVECEGQEGPENRDASKSGKKKLPEVSFEAEAQQGKVLRSRSTPVDTVRAARLAALLARLFTSTTRLASTNTPQKRISARHIAVGRKPYRRREITGRGMQNVLVVMDCSGSMSGFHMDEGKVFLAALSQLARQGYLKGHVVLSAIDNGRALWQRFRLPVAPVVLGHIQGFASGEGLEFALCENIQQASAADHVFVYTDGQITDRPINKAWLHRHGVQTWALYAGDDDGDIIEGLLEHFDKAIVRQDAEKLIESILSLR